MNKLKDFFSGKGFYVALFLGVFAFAILMIANDYREKDGKNAKEQAIDLNQPAENVAEIEDEVTEKEILQIEGNALMTDKFCQALVRTAVIIAKEFEAIDIMEFIRLSANFTPYPKEITLYREDFGSSDWTNLLDVLDIDYDNMPETIEIFAINKKELNERR